MSTENLNPDQNTPAPENQSQERQYTEIEVKAIEQGWIPKEEFDGDESEFIDAPEFVRRGELFAKIEKQSKEIKAVRQALEAFRIHHSKVKEAEYQRALNALKNARKEAFENGEHDKAFHYEDQIERIKEEKEQIVEELNQPVVDDNAYTEQFQSWVDSNPWYETNRVMRKAADALGLELHREGHSPTEVLKLVEAEIRKEFAHKFKTPASNRPNAVEASTRAGAKSKNDNFVLSGDEKAIMRKIVATGIMTEAEYIQQLKATR